MTLAERAVWLLAVVYAAVVSAVAGALLLVGTLVCAVPGLPGGFERRYAATTMRVLDALFRPVDALPSAEPPDGG